MNTYKVDVGLLTEVAKSVARARSYVWGLIVRWFSGLPVPAFPGPSFCGFDFAILAILFRSTDRKFDQGLIGNFG